MNEFRQQDIIKTAPPNTVLVFQKDDTYTAHGTIDGFFDSKTDLNKLTYPQYEALVRHALKNAKFDIKEYRNTVDDLYVLDRDATPYNWSHYLDIMDEEFVKPVCAITKSGSRVFASFYDFGEQTVFYTAFEDDDILSGLCSFFTEINSFDVVIDDLRHERALMNMGMSVRLVKDRVAPFSTVEGECYGKVIGLLVKYLNIGQPRVVLHNRKSFMQIDYKTLQNLDLLEIMKLIKPETIQGKRLLGQVCRQPLTDIGEILKRQEYVESLYNFNISSLKGFPDLIKYTGKLLRLRIPDIIVIYKAISRLDGIIHSLTSIDGDSTVLNDFIQPLISISPLFSEFRGEIEKIVNFEESSINQNVNEMICTLERERGEVSAQITEEYNRVLEINKKIKIEKKSSSAITFKIPRSEFAILKENNFVEKTILKSGIVFTTRTLEEFNCDLDRINREYLTEERKVLDSLLIYMNNYISSFDIMNYIVSMVDLFYAFSTLKNLGFTRPLIGNEFCLEGTFHPLVHNCIKNTVKLTTEKRFCVLTGPNMGGKSTFIKLCSIISILSQIGCLVPAAHATVPVMTGMYVRIGANDMASKGMSTFMVEMTDIARICKNATPQTLVIIDELGRGTSAVDGLSLALSIKEFLLKKKCYTLFATHFPEVCGEDVLNLKMTCQIGDGLTMLYKIEEGVCDVSLGIEVAESIGFPEEVIRMTREFLNEDLV